MAEEHNPNKKFFEELDKATENENIKLR